MSNPSLVHDALFYSDDNEYVERIRCFAREGLDANGSVLIAVPGPKLALLRAALAGMDSRVEFADMTTTGQNPARIMPFIRDFLDSHSDGPVRFVGEPIWAGRNPSEVTEGVRHEALINEAFVPSSAHILCPYDVRDLAPQVIEDARRTHPTILSDGERHVCGDYADPLVVYAAADRPLPEPATEPVEILLSDGLAHLRAEVKSRALSLGIDSDRVNGFVIAVNEAAANTLIHAAGRGTARIWRDEQDLVFEMADVGVIDDPLAGRRLPPPGSLGGRGLWLINQLSDLVELRSGKTGTVIRLHLRLA